MALSSATFFGLKGWSKKNTPKQEQQGAGKAFLFVRTYTIRVMPKCGVPAGCVLLIWLQAICKNHDTYASQYISGVAQPYVRVFRPDSCIVLSTGKNSVLCHTNKVTQFG